MNRLGQVAVVSLGGAYILWESLRILQKKRHAQKEIAWLQGAIAKLKPLEARVITARDKTRKLAFLDELLAESRALNMPTSLTDGGVAGIRRWSPQSYATRMQLLKAYYVRNIEQAELRGDQTECERAKHEAQRAFFSAKELYPSLFEDWDASIVVQPTKAYHFVPLVAALVLGLCLYAMLRRFSVQGWIAFTFSLLAAYVLSDLVRRFLRRSLSDIAENAAMDQKFQSLNLMIEKFRKLETLNPTQAIQFCDEFMKKTQSLGFYDPDMGVHPERWRERGDWSKEGFAKLMLCLHFYYAFWGQRERLKRDKGEQDEFEKVADEARRFFSGRERLLPDIFKLPTA